MSKHQFKVKRQYLTIKQQSNFFYRHWISVPRRKYSVTTVEGMVSGIFEWGTTEYKSVNFTSTGKFAGYDGVKINRL